MNEEEHSPEELEVLKRCQDACARIRELACSVHIFVTMHNSETGGTKHMNTGLGNWFARSDQVKEWVMENEETVKARAYRRVMEEGE